MSNSLNNFNSEYYKQKYLKYKSKYLSQKELIAGDPVLKYGNKSCPEKFGFYGKFKRGIKYYLEKYNCEYDDLVKKLDAKELETLKTDDIGSVDDIKILKRRKFPLLFFLNKNVNVYKLLEGGFNYEDFSKELDEKKILEKFKSKSVNINLLYERHFSINQIVQIFTSYISLQDFLKGALSESNSYMNTNPITYRMLKDAGFSPIELHARKNIQDTTLYKLIINYLNKIQKGKIGQYHNEHEETWKIFNLKSGEWTVTLFKKLISIADFKYLFERKKRVADKPGWFLDQFSFTKKELDKINGIEKLEEEDYKVSLKNIGTATELKRIDYNAVELKAAGFTVEELKAAGFTVEE